MQVYFSPWNIAHLIAEPIRGNCYMWSAPDQPFALPVRIKDFEALYKKEICKDNNAEAFEKSHAVDIKNKSQESIKIMAAELKEIIKKSKLSIQEFENNMFIGIYDGQLYRFIMEIREKHEDELRSGNTLKPILMHAVFECDIDEKPGEKGKYYCVPTKIWNSVLGK